ncbi:MAG: HAD hydrolase-like protein [Candidatus Omnitrophota bacterium]|nr:HAD hydrolase-like protein [Candidatus Omnitrophota bacterium]
MLSRNKSVKVIIFDLGNTLIRFDHRISAKKIASLFHLDSEKVRSLFFDSEITRDFEKGLISPKVFYSRVTEFLNIKIPFNDFVSIWNDIFWEDKESCNLARQLKSKYKLFLLSNVNRLHFEYIEKKFDIIKIFDEVILSFAVGAMKPEKKIFEDAVSKAGGDKSQVIYIDDREDLIREASDFGIESIRYEGADKLKEDLSQRGVL